MFETAIALLDPQVDIIKRIRRFVSAMARCSRSGPLLGILTSHLSSDYVESTANALHAQGTHVSAVPLVVRAIGAAFVAACTDLRHSGASLSASNRLGRLEILCRAYDLTSLQRIFLMFAHLKISEDSLSRSQWSS